MNRYIENTYPKYGTHKYCEACGALEFSEKYVPKEILHSFMGDELAEIEHMAKTCLNCGWVARERLYRDGEVA